MEPIRGVDVFIQINTGTVLSPTWTSVGGQRGGSFSGKGASLDCRSKDGLGWPNKMVGQNDWSISGDGLYAITDTGLDALRSAWLNRQQVQVRLAFNGESQTYTGMAIITQYDVDAPFDKESTAKYTLEGASALTIA
jgi:TP901-1 family phage major tail protein